MAIRKIFCDDNDNELEAYRNHKYELFMELSGNGWIVMDLNDLKQFIKHLQDIKIEIEDSKK